MNALMQPFPHLLSTVVEITVKSTFMLLVFGRTALITVI
jgi:hypothetical protein